MLFKMTQLPDVAAGRITVAYRRWTRPTVKKGGKLRTPVCVLAIDDVTKVRGVRADDVARTGFASANELRAALAAEGDLYRVEFHVAGDDERKALRETKAEGKEREKLEKLGDGALDLLELLEKHPATRAAILAERVGKETLDFKDDVRKLKALGLTESLDVGYRVSPRGLAWLDEKRPGRVRPAPRTGAAFPLDVVASLTRAKSVPVRIAARDAGAKERAERAQREELRVCPAVVDGRVFARAQKGDPDWWRDGRAQLVLGQGGRAGVWREQLLDVTLRIVPLEDAAGLARAVDDELVRKLPKSAPRVTTVEITPASS